MSEKMTFAEHKEQTVKDCEAVIVELNKVIAEVKEGNIAAFEKFWFVDGTEEGDSKIEYFRDLLYIRYCYRMEELS